MTSLLLTVDIGNTNLLFGLFEGNSLKHTWRMATSLGRTADEFTAFLSTTLQRKGVKPEEIGEGVVASVVPSMEIPLRDSIRDFFGVDPLFIQPGVKTGLVIHYDPPQDVGADRIVNAVALKVFYSTPGIVVDFGTATTFDVVSAEGAYEGGLIAPGVHLSVEALHTRAARLPRVEIREPDSIIGKTTVGSIQSGIYYGTLAMVEGVLDRLIKEIGLSCKVVATGGFAPLIFGRTPLIHAMDPHLTLKGLKVIHDKNR